MQWRSSRSCLAMVVWLAVVPACAHDVLLAQTPEDLVRQELTPSKTGQVKTPSDPDDRAATPIVQPRSFDQPTRETPASTPTPAPAPAPVQAGVPPDVLALRGTVNARMNELRTCRREIAADRRVAPERVAAEAVLLRWTIQPGGGVSDAEVVAEGKTDPDVLSCVKRMMSGWVFVRAPGGAPLPVEQRLTF
jgi:hypothetical protein